MAAELSSPFPCDSGDSDAPVSMTHQSYAATRCFGIRCFDIIDD